MDLLLSENKKSEAFANEKKASDGVKDHEEKEMEKGKEKQKETSQNVQLTEKTPSTGKTIIIRVKDPQTKISNLPELPAFTTSDVTKIIEKAKDIVPKIENVGDLEKSLKREKGETENVFNLRKNMTLKLYALPDLKGNAEASIVAGHLIINMIRLGVKYTPEIDEASLYLMKRIQS